MLMVLGVLESIGRRQCTRLDDSRCPATISQAGALREWGQSRQPAEPHYFIERLGTRGLPICMVMTHDVRFWDEKAPDIFDELIAPPGPLPLPRDSTRVKQTLHPTHLASQTKTCLKVSLNDARASPPCPDRFHVTRVNKIPDRRKSRSLIVPTRQL